MTAKKRTNATPGGSILTHQRPSAVRLFALVFALVAALAIVLGATLSAAHAAPVGKLKQFKVPTADIQPRSITNGSDGNLWFTLSDPNANVPSQIGRITPAGVITEFDPACNGCILTDIIQGPGDILYYTSNDPFLGRITASRPDPRVPSQMPETDVLAGNLAVHDDEIWFTDFNNDSLWRYDVVSEQFTQFPVPRAERCRRRRGRDRLVHRSLEPGIRKARPGDRRRDGHADHPSSPGRSPSPPTGTSGSPRASPRGGRASGPGDRGGDGVPADRRGPGGHCGIARRHGLVHPDHQGQHRPDRGLWCHHRGQGRTRTAEPFGITVAPNGAPWYTMMSANKIATLRLEVRCVEGRRLEGAGVDVRTPALYWHPTS